MRLAVDHRTRYRFSAPQARLVQLLRMTPSPSHDQAVIRWRIDVDRDARLRRGTDGFGNLTTMLYVDGPLEAIEIAVAGEVLTSHSDGMLHGVDEALPPALFARSTPATAADEAIVGFASAAAAGQDALGSLHRLNTALARRFVVDDRRPEPGLTAVAAFVRERTTSRDLAQIFVAAARGIGAPARYVSGYRLAGDGDEHHPTPHGWAEAHVDGIGWIGFDPTTGLCPEDRYVRVAAALDAAGAAPLAGWREGGGAEELDVDVTLHPEA